MAKTKVNDIEQVAVRPPGKGVPQSCRGNRKRTYWEKLKDPRWQRKRLEVMERAGFACENCGDKENTLNVHHGYYERGLEPWDYRLESLHCLCEACHEEIRDVLRDAHWELSQCSVVGVWRIVSFLSHWKNLSGADRKLLYRIATRMTCPPSELEVADDGS